MIYKYVSLKKLNNFFIHFYLKFTSFLFNTKLMQSYQYIQNPLSIIWIIREEQLRITKGLYQDILANLLFSL